MHRKLLLYMFAVGTAVFAASPASSQSITYEVVLANAPAEFLGAGVEFQSLGVEINESGDAAIFGRLTGSGITSQNNETIWLLIDGQIQLIARTGRPAAGIDIFTTYSDLHSFTGLTDDGRIAFSAQLAGPDVDDSNSSAFWVGNATSLPLIARAGDVIPGLDGVQTYRFISSNFGVSRNGLLSVPVYYAPDAGSNQTEQAILTGPPDNLSAYITSDDLATPPGSENISGLNLTNSIPINQRGQIYFSGDLPNDGRGLFLSSPQSVSTIVVQNAQVPGYAAGVQFTEIRLDGLSEAGMTSFRTTYVGPGINNNNNVAFWVVDPVGNRSELVREGVAIPVQGGQTSLRQLDSVEVNDNGSYVFGGRYQPYEGSSIAGHGVWFGDDDGIELIAQEFDVIPGAEGFVFGEVYSMAINNRDLAVFHARMYVDEINGNTFRNAFFAYRDGVLVPLVVDQDIIDVSADGNPADLREFDYVGSFSRLTDNDQIALTLLFSDGPPAILQFDLRGVFAPGIAGDLTGDDIVGAEDLDVLLAHWGETTFAGSWRDGDANGDGIVGQGDLDLVIANWGQGVPPNGVIPEPASGAALILLGCLVGHRRRI